MTPLEECRGRWESWFKRRMPRVSAFYGLEVYLYYNDEHPPHVHVTLPGYHAAVGIDPVRLIDGALTNRAESMVLGWAGLYQPELRTGWDLAEARLPLKQIDPLA